MERLYTVGVFISVLLTFISVLIYVNKKHGVFTGKDILTVIILVGTSWIGVVVNFLYIVEATYNMVFMDGREK